MNFKDALSSLVKAKISIESLQTVGGFLVMEDKHSDFSHEFCEQVVQQCAAHQYTAVGDTNKDAIIDFEIPIGNVCHVANVICNISKINPAAKSLMPDWQPFLDAALHALDAEVSGVERRFDELGPERMN